MRNRALVVAALLATCAVGAMPAHATPTQTTATPIKHLVVIFQENVSFDHYFGTYPNATNPAGEPSFTPLARTPSVNGLNEDLLTSNPNLANPFRLDRSQELHLRPGPRLHARAAGVRRRPDGHVRAVHRRHVPAEQH